MLDKKNFVFINEKTDFELDFCIHAKHVLVKMYKPLLKKNMGDEYVKDFMIKWAKK